MTMPAQPVQPVQTPTPMAERKTKWTKEQIIAAIEAADGLVFNAAKALGCAPRTIRNAAQRWPAVQEAIEAQRGLLLDLGESALKQAVIVGEGWAVCFLLKTLGQPRGYIEKQQIEHSGEIQYVVEAPPKAATVEEWQQQQDSEK